MRIIFLMFLLDIKGLVRGFRSFCRAGVGVETGQTSETSAADLVAGDAAGVAQAAVPVVAADATADEGAVERVAGAERVDDAPGRRRPRRADEQLPPATVTVGHAGRRTLGAPSAHHRRSVEPKDLIRKGQCDYLIRCRPCPKI